MQRVQTLAQAQHRTTPAGRRRGTTGQRCLRDGERTVRRRAVALSRWLSRLGLTRAEAAVRLGIAPRTLERWRTQWQHQRLRTPSRGRPRQRSDRQLRNRLLTQIDVLGPRVGVPTLQALCPEMPRAELREVLGRYRQLCKRRRRLLARTLHWQRPGTVWAIDFTQPPRPVEGCFRRVLAGRDLASGYQLLWLPTTDESASAARDALEMLFAQHGAPLVLKSDNGSAFVARVMEELLAAAQVWHLLSPPRLPQYNGSCEAGIGSLKTRTHHQAAQAGHAGEWTCDDLEAARQLANATARPWGHRGPTPEEAWSKRTVLSAGERLAFAVTVQQLQQQALKERGYATEGELPRAAQAAVAREALSRALVEEGLLSISSPLSAEPI